jgi:hypothetical protein
MRRSLTDRLVRRIYYKYFARNILYELQLRARAASADYAERHMREAVIFEDSHEFLRFCVRRAPRGGAFLEFGVGGGGTITTIANACQNPVYGFDSFEGLPADWTGHVETRGAFSQRGAPPRVPGNVVLLTGLFSNTISQWLGAHDDLVGFLHVDCDLYTSTRDVL